MPVDSNPPLTFSLQTLASHLGTVMHYRYALGDAPGMVAMGGDVLKLTGHAPEALIGDGGLRYDELIHPSDRMRVQQELARALQARGHYAISYRIRRGDGEDYWVKDAGCGIREDDGWIAREGVIADITQQRLATQRLQRQQQELESTRDLIQAILDAMEIHLLVLDGEGRIVMVNQAWLNHEFALGQTRTRPEDWLGVDYFAMDGAHGDALNADEQRLQAGIYELQTGQRSQFLMEMASHLPWEQCWFHLAATRLQGDWPGVVISRRDITALKQTEVALGEQRTYLNSILDSTTHLGIVAVNREMRIAFFNPAAERILGYRKQEVIGRPLEVIHREVQVDPEQVRRGLQAVAERGEHCFETSGYRGMPDHLFENRITPILDPAGEVLGYILSARDITGERAHLAAIQQLNTELEQRVQERTRELSLAKEVAEQASQAKSVFLANMSHEIRTPMNAIMGMTDLVLDMPLEKKQYKLLRSVSDAAKSLLRILNDILDLSKLESGKMELEVIPFSLHDVLTGVTEAIGPGAASKGLRLEVAVDATAPPGVLGDPTKLRQVLLNLSGNAVKFTPSGSITLSVRPGPHTDDWHFSVRDTGIGIAPEHLDKVFERFSQADATTTRRFGGTGLGTTISRGIIEQMGGRIWVKSVLGQGSDFQFIVRLPEAVGVVQADVQSGPALKHAPYTRPLKILLAEDIPLNQELVVIRLGQRRHEIVVADNGRIAVEQFRKERFDLILMDAHMPEMDGLEAIRAIRVIEQTTGGHIPIIMLTASVMQSDKDTCLDAGADEFVGKPIDFTELYGKMAQFFPIVAEEPEPLPALTSAPALPHLLHINLREGVSRWGNLAAFRKALLGFERDYATITDRLREVMAAERYEEALLLAHTVKGVSANLGLQEVSAPCNEIEQCLRAGRYDVAEPLAGLDRHLEMVMEEILMLADEIGSPPLTPSVGVIDAAKVLPLLDRLIEGLDSFERDEPAIDSLRDMLDAGRFGPLEALLDAFEFDQASACAQELRTAIQTSLRDDVSDS